MILILKPTLKFLKNNEVNIYLNHLRNLTNNIIEKKNRFLDKEIEKLQRLDEKILRIKKISLSEIQKIYFIVDDCKKLGSLPFAGIARIAFIYTKLLNTLKKNDFINDQDFELFYENCSTITKKMQIGLNKIKEKGYKKKFLQEFRHLRPSTYSISSKNYEENFDNYFSKILKLHKNKKSLSILVQLNKKKLINSLKNIN